MGVREHEKAARARRGRGPIRCAVITVSDTRTPQTDESGDLACRLLEARGYGVEHRGIVPNDEVKIRRRVKMCERDGMKFVLAIGGTGVGRRDVTVEAVEPLLAKVLPGFGELFRRLSYGEIGAAAMLSRALLGVTPGGCAVACTPGSPAAVRLALEKLLLPQLPHLLSERA